jgi:aconitase A
MPTPSQIETKSIIDDYKELGLFHAPDTLEAKYSATLCLDLATAEPSAAGPTGTDVTSVDKSPEKQCDESGRFA